MRANQFVFFTKSKQKQKAVLVARPGKTIGGITTRDIREFAVPSCVGSRADGTRLGGVSPGAKFPEEFEDAGNLRMVADCVWIGGRTPPKGIDVTKGRLLWKIGRTIGGFIRIGRGVGLLYAWSVLAGFGAERVSGIAAAVVTVPIPGGISL